MPDMPSNDDLRTFYRNTLAMVKGEPVRVIDIGPQGRIIYRDLFGGEVKQVTYDPRVVCPPPRIGYVNCEGEVAYFVRKPLRRMSMGLSDAATARLRLENVRYSDQGVMSCDICSPFVAKAIKGEYPTIPQALRMVKMFGGVVAFDKSLAVDEERTIYYKKSVAGYLPPGKSDLKSIVFNPGFEYLNLITNGVFK